MIRLGFAIVNFLLVCQVFGQEIPLIRFRDQHFWIQDGNSKVQLPSTYEFVLPFQNPDYSFYIKNGKKGIIGNKGQEYTAAKYDKIEHLGQGFFSFFSDSIYTANIYTKELYVGRATKKNEYWVVISHPDSSFFLNLKTGKTVSQKPNQRTYNTFLVEHYRDSLINKITLTDSTGRRKEITGIEEQIVQNDTLFLFTQGDKKVVLTPSQIFQFTTRAKINFKSALNYTFSVSHNGLVKLYSIYSKDPLYEMEGEELEFDDNPRYLQIKRKGKWGLIDYDRNWVMECKYDAIEVNKDYIVGANINRSGEILRLSDRKKFPFPYDQIYPGTAFHTVSYAGLYGVCDTSRFKEILPPLYAQVQTFDTLLVGITTESQRRMGIDSSLQVIYDITVPKFKEFRTKPRKDHDPRLDAQGWFYVENEVLDREGFLTGTRRTYGLVNDTGAMLLKPTLVTPRFLFGRNYVLFEAGSSNVSDGSKSYVAKEFGLGFLDGKLNSGAGIYSIKQEDIFKNEYIRFRSNTKPGIITMDGKLVYFDLIDFLPERLPRVCFDTKDYKKINNPTKTSLVSVESINTGIPGIIQEKTSTTFINYSYYDKPVEYEGGKWNFLADDGSLLFEENLEFTFPFSQGRSIAKSNGKWGVLSDTGFVIPPIYNDINRLFTFREGTLSMSDAELANIFIVTKSTNKPVLRDINFRELNVDFDRVVSKDEDLLLVEKNGSVFLLNEKLDVLDDEAEKTNFIGNGMYFKKDEEGYSVYDLNGTFQCGTQDYRPYKMIFDAYVLCKLKGKYFLFNIAGDSICQSKSKRFQITAETAFVSDGKKFHILLKDGTVITSQKNLELIADNEGKFYGTIEGGKVKVFNTKGERISSVKTNADPYLVNGRLIYKEDKWKVLNLIDGQTEEMQDELSEVEIFDQYYHLIKFKNKKQLLYDNKWNEIPLGKRFRIKYWEEGVLLLTGQNQSYLYANNEMIELPSSWKIIGASHFGKIIAEENGRQFYINQKGELLFGKTFLQCTEFNGEAAAVNSYSGWTLINEKGDYLHYPSFGEIVNATENTFIETKRTTFGLYDENGLELLEPIYQRIDLIEKDLLVCLLDGYIVYFHLSDILKNKRSNSINF